LHHQLIIISKQQAAVIQSRAQLLLRWPSNDVQLK